MGQDEKLKYRNADSEFIKQVKSAKSISELPHIVSWGYTLGEYLIFYQRMSELGDNADKQIAEQKIKEIQDILKNRRLGMWEIVTPVTDL